MWVLQLAACVHFGHVRFAPAGDGAVHGWLHAPLPVWVGGTKLVHRDPHNIQWDAPGSEKVGYTIAGILGVVPWGRPAARGTLKHPERRPRMHFSLVG
jgi:hypothetical protein